MCQLMCQGNAYLAVLMSDELPLKPGESWRSSVAPSRATKDYIARIQEVSSDPNKAYLLIAHQYTRYVLSVGRLATYLLPSR